MNLSSLLQENVYLISVALFLIGLLFKQTSKIPNWSIPYILTILGVLACFGTLGFSVNSAIQGIISAGVAVYIHQLGKQCISCINEKSGKDSSESKS